MKRKLVVFGVGDIARIAAHLFELHTDYEVVAHCVDRDYLEASTFLGRPVVAFESVVDAYPPSDYDLFVAVSYSQMNRLREDRCETARQLGYKLPTYVSPHATCLVDRETNIGDNCLIFEDNTIQPFVTIGDNVTLWSGNHIGHDSSIEDNVFVSSHVVVSGNVTVGRNSFLGVNTTIRDGLTIAPYTLSGAGALLAKDTVEGGIYTNAAARLRESADSRDLDSI